MNLDFTSLSVTFYITNLEKQNNALQLFKIMISLKKILGGPFGLGRFMSFNHDLIIKFTEETL